MKVVQHFVSAHQAKTKVGTDQVELAPQFYAGMKGQDISYFESAGNKYALQVAPSGKLNLRELKPLEEESDAASATATASPDRTTKTAG